MDRDLLDYYNGELTFLRELGAEFAAAHPIEAARLALEENHCEDPHVERLLQGFAFLAARIRRKLDDEYPEITEAFLSIVFPHYPRPIPSLTIAQFSPAADPTRLLEGFTIPADTELLTRPIDDIRCSFRTRYPVTLWPVTVESASLSPDQVLVEGKPRGAEALLTMGLSCQANDGWAALKPLRSLRFYLDGKEPLPSALYELLFAQLCGVWIRGKAASGEVRTLPLDTADVRPVGLGPDEGLWPYPSHALPGYRLLQEFFALPEKFLFFEVHGLERLASAGLVGKVELLFFFRQPPRSALAVRPEGFKLACTPAVNLFDRVSEPIRMDGLRSEYPVVADLRRRHAFEVFSINRVVSVGAYLEEPVEYLPFYGLGRGAPASGGRDAYWYASRSLSPGKLEESEGGTEVHLSFVDPGFRPTVPTSEAITAYLTCTNRDLPARLPFGGGQGDLSMEGEAPIGRVRYLTRPTAALRPPAGRKTQWMLISSLSLNHLSLATADPSGRPSALHDLLTVYDFANTPGTRKMIRGILDIAHERIPGRVPGDRKGKGLCMGLRVDLTFDDAAYPGEQAFLLAAVLERFLAAYATINSFTQTVIKRKQRKEIWKMWSPRAGDRTLL
ncbi:MAG: type VI secretion system baseplate subunit TssF [Isosphaeraceae bacterium]